MHHYVLGTFLNATYLKVSWKQKCSHRTVCKNFPKLKKKGPFQVIYHYVLETFFQARLTTLGKKDDHNTGHNAGHNDV